jgi:hypothetical protein
LVNEVLPAALLKLSYKETQSVHLITFDSNVRHYSVKVKDMKTLSMSYWWKSGDGNNYFQAIQKCHELFQSFDATKPVRVLTISDGEVEDPEETNKASAVFVEYINSNGFSINSQAVRLFTSNNQPDTKALCTLLQINNTTTSELLDIETKASNEMMAAKIAALFQTDNFSSRKILSDEKRIFLNLPWDSTALTQVMIRPGQNLVWLKEVPSNKIQIGESPVKVVMQKPLTLGAYQSLMEQKLHYILDHMKILKVVGTVEANKVVDAMLAHFQAHENNLNHTDLTSNDFSVLGAVMTVSKLIVNRKKISGQLSAIAHDEKIRNFNSLQIAEYLRDKPSAH